ncbi:MAG: TRAP transporter small permease subunit [Pseudomonadota bacterium]
MALNSAVLALTRTIAWIALAIMVAVILLQVVFRYVFNNALPWPEEAARFCMLWMTGMAAPSALRWGGFVAIDMLENALPRVAAQILSLILLTLSGLVLFVAIQYGWNHTFGFGGNFNAAALTLPFDWVGGESVKVKLRYMYGALLFGIVMMLVINLELWLRTLVTLIKPDTAWPSTGEMVAVAD